jgi:folate-binding Fe-S cluster repair protein YgfZ
MGIVRFAGPDATGFLQGQLSNDTRRLSAGSPLLAAYSTPQGRVVAVLHILPHSSGLVALVPRDVVLPLIERLRKYVLRAKVRIEDLSAQFAVFGRYASDTTAELPVPDLAQGYREHNGIGVARVAADPDRQWVIGSVQDLAKHGLAADAGTNANFDAITGANANANAKANTNDDANANANTKANTKAKTNDDANANTGASTHLNTGANTNANADANSDADANANADPGATAPARPQRVEQAWRLADIRCGLPQIYAATSEMFAACTAYAYPPALGRSGKRCTSPTGAAAGSRKWFKSDPARNASPCSIPSRVHPGTAPPRLTTAGIAPAHASTRPNCRCRTRWRRGSTCRRVGRRYSDEG